MSETHYVYEWWRMDLNLPYYVGKGSGKRAYELSRNDHADKVTAALARNGIAREVRIIARFLTAEAAFKFEIERIAFWWHLTEFDVLTNQTKGGEGAASGELNPQKRPEARVRVSIQMSGDRNPMKNPAIAEKNHAKTRGRPNPKVAGPNNGMYGKKCRLIRHTEETKEKMRGPKNQEHIESMVTAQRSRREEERKSGTTPKGWKNPGPAKRWASATEEDRARHGKATRTGLFTYYKNISDDDYAHLCLINAEKSHNFWETITEEKYESFVESHRVSTQRVWDNRGPDERRGIGEKISDVLSKRTAEDNKRSGEIRWETRRKNDEVAKAEGKLTSAEKIGLSHKSRRPDDIKSSHEKRVAVCRQKDEIRKASGQPTSHEKAWETRRRNGTDKINPNRSRTKEEKTAEGKKGWETRRRNKAEALAAKEKSNAHG